MLAFAYMIMLRAWKLTYLEATHVTGIASILETILIALQEEFQEKSRGKVNVKKVHECVCVCRTPNSILIRCCGIML